MGQIQSNVGLITGINIEDTVNQLMALNSIPRNRLQSRTDLLQREQVAVTELMTLVVGVQLTTDRLGQSSLFSATTVSSSNETALSARSTGSPTPGNFTFVPVRQAQSQQLTSSLFASGDQTFSAGEVVIHTGGFLDESVSLDSLNGGQGVDRGYIKITDLSGVSESIDLRFSQSANDVVDAINSSDILGVVASIEGDHLVLTDVSGGSTTNLTVEEVSGGTTAADLGLSNISTASTTASGSSIQSLSLTTGLSSLRDGRGIEILDGGNALQFQLSDGTTVDFATELDSNTASLGQLIDEINTAGETSLQASISSDGKSIQIEDLTSGSTTFAISSPTGDLAEQLGLDNAAASGVITGDQLISGLSDTLLSSLNGGVGLGTLGSISITDRSGAAETIDLSAAVTLNDVIDSINAASVSVTAQLNETKTGIEINDTSGSTSSQLIVADADTANSATALQIEGSVASDSIDSGSLNRQFVTRNTLLDDFNQGRGITYGSIQFTDSSGTSAIVNLSSKAPETIGDVVDEINDLGLGITASINETGDGLLLVDTAGGTGELTVEDSGGGSAAEKLGIAGTSESLTVSGSTVTGIDGSQTVRITTTAETTLSGLTDEINALSNSPVSASLLNLSASGGVRLLLNSASTGLQGRVAIDSDVGISFSETSTARDALLAFGANESSGGVLVSSSTNTFDGLVEDVEFTIGAASETPISVTIAENNDNISKQLETFVDQFNKLRDKFDDLTVFDETTQSVGLLFGKTSALRVDFAYGRLLSSAFRDAGSIGSLGQVGIRLNDKGKLEFDKSKFEAAYEADATAVQEFFTTETNGFSAKAKATADSLASVETGALLNRTSTLTTQIEQNNQRIESLDVRLDRQRTRLLTQFYNMETTIARLQQNLSALNQLQVIPPL